MPVSYLAALKRGHGAVMTLLAPPESTSLYRGIPFQKVTREKKRDRSMIAYPKGHPLSLIYLWKQIFECLNILCVHLSLSLSLSLSRSRSLSLERARSLSYLSLSLSLSLSLARSLALSTLTTYLFVCIDMFIIGKCAHARSCMCACVEMHML